MNKFISFNGSNVLKQYTTSQIYYVTLDKLINVNITRAEAARAFYILPSGLRPLILDIQQDNEAVYLKVVFPIHAASFAPFDDQTTKEIHSFSMDSSASGILTFKEAVACNG